MADSTTPVLGLTQPEVGASPDTWGGKINAALLLLDTAIGLLINTANYAAAGGTVDAIELTINPVWTAYVAGQRVRFKAAGANTTGVTADVSGLGAKTVKTSDGAALPAGYLQAGVIYELDYNGVDLVVSGPAPASVAEALAGANTLKYLTAGALGGLLSLANPGYLKIPGGGVIMWGKNALGTDTTLDVALPLALSATTNAIVLASYAGTVAPVAGTSISGFGARFNSTSSIKLSNDNLACDIHWLVIGPL